jgi:signal peptidase II
LLTYSCGFVFSNTIAYKLGQDRESWQLFRALFLILMKFLMKKNYLFWLVAIVGLIVDRLTKYWTTESFDRLCETFPLWQGVFHFTYTINSGAAFSLFSDGNDGCVYPATTGSGVLWLRWLSLIVSLVLVAYALFSNRLKPLEQIGFGFILAGALGNGIDRFTFGYVIDFLDFRLIRFPVFNLADVCINLGMICLLYIAFFTPSATEKHKIDK